MINKIKDGYKSHTTRNLVVHDRFSVTYLETVTNVVLSVTVIVFPSRFGRIWISGPFDNDCFHNPSLRYWI